MSGEFFEQITWGQRGDYIFWIAEILPIFLWGFLIAKYYLAHRKDFEHVWISNFLLLIPVFGILLNLYMSTWDDGPSVPRAWDFLSNIQGKTRRSKEGCVGVLQL